MTIGRTTRLILGIVSALILAFSQSPGLTSPDTKLDLTANPLRFLARATNLWSSDLPFGQAQNQSYGYLFPHGAVFLLGDFLGLPGWVTQRLWWAILLTVGFWGVLRVGEALNDGRGIGTTSSRVLAAAAFALSPRVLTTLGSISSETLPMMLAPWVHIERVLTVGPGAFTPPPKVASAVVRITPLATPAFDIGSAASFERVVRAAFAQRRKTLRNALKGTVAAGVLEQLGIDPRARAETLAAAQYAALARAAG